MIDNKTQSNKIEDQIVWYKATERNNFELWDMQALQTERQAMGLVRKPEDDDEGPYNPQIIKKRNAPTILVTKGY